MRIQHKVALEGSRVALNLARSLTSHIRRIFLKKYAGKYTFSSAVFTFDVILIVFALALCVGSIIFSFFASKQFDGGLRIESSANEMFGSEEVPITFSLFSTNGQAHENVRLRIQVPEWAEIIRTEPARDSEGIMNFGTIEKNERVTAHVLIRSRMEHVQLPLSFFVIQDDWSGFVRYVEGRVVHRIGASRMTVETKSEVHAVDAHATIPIIVRNTATSRVPNIIFRIASSEGAQTMIGDAHSIALGAMEAHESRTIFVDAYDVTTSTIALHWQIQDGPQAATSGTAQVYMISGSKMDVQNTVLGKNLPVSSEARYYAASGDQIGVGPLPPKNGYTTTYWAAFILGPTQSALKNIVLTTTLPKGVSATGKFASPVQADFSKSNDKIEWHIPTMPLIGAEQAVFAFEIQYTPSASDVGKSTELVLEGETKAETDAGVPLFASIPLIMTGIVQP